MNPRSLRPNSPAAASVDGGVPSLGLTLRQLEVFVAVARSGSLAGAERRCGLTRAAASMALSALERSSGGPLFTRAGRGLRLNDRGRRLLPGAEGLVAGAGEWLSSARGRPGQLVGELRLGCSLTVGNYCLPPLLPAFLDEHPSASLSIRIVNSAEVADGLRSGAYDLGLVEGEVPAGLDTEKWAVDELALVAPASHSLASLRRVPLRALGGRTWLVREPGSGTREIAEAFLARLSSVAGRLELGGAEAIKRSVAAGLGLALLSRHAVAEELASGRLCELRIARPPRRHFRIVTVPGQHRSSLCSGFIAWLRAHQPPSLH